MTRSTRGFTTIELMMVTTITGIIAAMGVPRLTGAIAKSEVRAAQRVIVAQASRARSVALQRRRASQLVITGNAVKVTVESAGIQTNVLGPVDLGEEHRVTLGSDLTVAFDSRGFAVGLGGVQRIALARGGDTAVVCVSRLGNVSTRGC